MEKKWTVGALSALFLGAVVGVASAADYRQNKRPGPGARDVHSTSAINAQKPLQGIDLSRPEDPLGKAFRIEMCEENNDTIQKVSFMIASGQTQDPGYGDLKDRIILLKSSNARNADSLRQHGHNPGPCVSR